MNAPVNAHKGCSAATPPQRPQQPPHPLHRTEHIGWLTALMQLSQASTGGQGGAVDAMLRHVVQGFGGSTGCLAVCQDDSDDALTIVAAIDLPPGVVGQRVAPGQGVLGHVHADGRALVLEGDAGADARFAGRAGAGSARAQSALCWPLAVDARRIGVLSINRRGDAAPFDARDLEHGAPVIALLALVVDHWRMHARLCTQVDRLSAANAELHAAHQRLEQTQHQLLQSEKMASIGQLAAGVAHEINNPVGYVASNLSTLRGYVQEIFAAIDRPAGAAAPDAGEIDFLREDTVALLAECDEGLGRVKKIVQDLKDFSRIDQAEAMAEADLIACLDSTLNIAHNEIKYLATVERALQPLPPVRCNASQVNQVLLNLLVNAAHAIRQAARGGDGRIALRSGHEPADGGGGGEVWIEVEDNGCGIAPEHLSRIFEPFFTTKPVGQGTGLGLSLSYSIVREHGGRIEVHSTHGAGSRFRVVLPLHEAAVPES